MTDDLTTAANDLAHRAFRVARLIPSVEQHLLDEQADAVAASEHPLDRMDRERRKEKPTNPTGEEPINATRSVAG